MKKIFEDPKTHWPNDVHPLTPFSRNSTFYVKHIDPARFKISKSFNFVRALNRRAQEVDLIFGPKTFNISENLNGDKYVLCTNYRLYVLLFVDETSAHAFRTSVKDDLNVGITCSNDWLTLTLMRQIDSPIIPRLPHLPYLKAYIPAKQK